MLKKLSIFILLFALIVSICLTLAAHFFKPILKEKFLEVAEAGLGRGVSISEFDIKLTKKDTIKFLNIFAAD